MILAVFFTRGVSLQNWYTSGILDREQLIYIRLLNEGVLSKVLWFTYGPSDMILSKHLQESGQLDIRIQVLGSQLQYSQTRIGSLIWSLLIPLRFRRLVARSTLIISNQFDGSWAAILSGALFRVPVISRGGYVKSQLMSHLSPKKTLRLALERIIELLVVKYSTAIVVTSKHSFEYLSSLVGQESSRKITILPTAVDTNLFVPASGKELNRTRFYTSRCISVGRLSHEKNYESLIWACRQAGVGLDIVGTGKDWGDLKKYSRQIGADVRFLGKVDNSQLSKLLMQYNVFCLCSHSEGFPKALVEAMSSGLLCVGTDVAGISEIIIDGYNGLLAKNTNGPGIVIALERMKQMSLTELAEMKRVARMYVLERYSIEGAVSNYRSLMRRLAKV